jgi:hypothetical protein
MRHLNTLMKCYFLTLCLIKVGGMLKKKYGSEKARCFGSKFSKPNCDGMEIFCLDSDSEYQNKLKSLVSYYVTNALLTTAIPTARHWHDRAVELRY